MTIYIFGDSFCDPNNKGKVENHKTWYELLSEKETVYNFGLSGMGPYHLFDEFYLLYENGKFSEQDKFIFILSSPYRFPLASMSIEEQGTYMARLRDFKILDENDIIMKEIKSYSYDSLLIFDTFKRELDFINLKNTSFLKDLTKINNWKSIVFWVYGLDFNVNKIDYNFDLYDLTKFNDENFKFFKYPLNNIADNEYLNKKHCWKTKNHLTERNHIILYNIISNHFYNTNFSEVFHKKFIKNFIEKEDKIDFIYE